MKCMFVSGIDLHGDWGLGHGSISEKPKWVTYRIAPKSQKYPVSETFQKFQNIPIPTLVPDWDPGLYIINSFLVFMSKVLEIFILIIRLYPINPV